VFNVNSDDHTVLIVVVSVSLAFIILLATLSNVANAPSILNSSSINSNGLHEAKIVTANQTNKRIAVTVQGSTNIPTAANKKIISNPSTVSVIVNGIKPYQNAIGHKVQKDYSRWTFLVLPKHTNIEEGMNKVASRISCDNKPSLVSYYTLNVTGLAGGSCGNSHLHLTQHNMSYLFQPTPLINHLSFPADSAASSNSSNSGSSSDYHHSTFTSVSPSDSNRGRHHHSTFTSVSCSDYSNSSGSHRGRHHHSTFTSDSSRGRHHHSIYGKDHPYGKSSRHHRVHGGYGLRSRNTTCNGLRRL
jgi:hypothetical protein